MHSLSKSFVLIFCLIKEYSMQTNLTHTILDALTLGKDALAPLIVTDAYNTLKACILAGLRNNPRAQEVFAQFIANPQANQDAMANEIKKSGVLENPQAVGAAHTILNNAINIIYADGGSKVNIVPGNIYDGSPHHNNSYLPFIALGAFITIAIVAYLAFSHNSSSAQPPIATQQSIPTTAVKTPTPTPNINNASETMYLFCKFLNAHDAQTAYNTYTTSNYQQHHPFTSDFSPQFSNGSNPFVSNGGCQSDIATKSQNIVTAHFTFTQQDASLNPETLVNYKATLIPQDQGWLIDNIVQEN
jgi:hypothetical protein